MDCERLTRDEALALIDEYCTYMNLANDRPEHFAAIRMARAALAEKPASCREAQ